jgi:hypothetical protein
MIIPLSITALMIGTVFHTDRLVHADQTVSPAAHVIRLGAARPGFLYAITLGVKNPAQLQGSDAVRLTVNDAQGEVASKWLHTADLDFYLTLRPRAAGPVTVSLSSASSAKNPEISATLSKILQGSAGMPGRFAAVTRGVIAAAPNGT